MKKVLLYGASGHGKVIADIAEKLGIEVLGFIDANPEIKEVSGYKVISNSLENFNGSAIVVSIGNNIIRKKIVTEHPDFNFEKLIAPTAAISNREAIGKGTVVMHGVTINIDSKIGQHCIVNTNASVDHDCVVGDYVHISPNAALAGNVNVGEGTHVGLGASIIQGIKIGKWCTIGAGAVIIEDVPDGATVVGNPGRVIKRKIEVLRG